MCLRCLHWYVNIGCIKWPPGYVFCTCMVSVELDDQLVKTQIWRQMSQMPTLHALEDKDKDRIRWGGRCLRCLHCMHYKTAPLSGILRIHHYVVIWLFEVDMWRTWHQSLEFTLVRCHFTVKKLTYDVCDIIRCGEYWLCMSSEVACCYCCVPSSESKTRSQSQYV